MSLPNSETSWTDGEGECPDCRMAGQQYCPKANYTGIHVDGAFAEYELIDSRTLVEIPDSLSFEQASQINQMKMGPADC